MNVINGHIIVGKICSCGVDEFNRKLPAKVEWGEPIRCRIQQMSSRYDAPVIDGVKSQCSYKIFCDFRYFGAINFNPQIVRITKDERELGEYQVQAVLHNKMLGRTEIFVGVRSNKQLTYA